MRVLSLALLFLVIAASKLPSDSPHGRDFDISCDVCHNPNGWKIDMETFTFDHSGTAFNLEGRHSETECRRCHPSLVFRDAEPECLSCHTDMHNNTVGTDCDRCHTSTSWIVDNINMIHQQSRFPLLGPHYTAECSQCHPSASLLMFEPIGIECFDCHQADYYAATSPNHKEGNYSQTCTDCHLMHNFTWKGAGIDHSIFPLTGGHALDDCSKCHTGNDYSTISPACVSCHLTDYNNTTNPNHSALSFENNCEQCHTLNPGWKPANYQQHDVLFPIYSGKHGGEWGSCTDCHTNTGNYSVFSCIDCHDHNKPDMDDEHDEVGGYAYNSLACFGCHPTGDAEEGFNHALTNFPLTGAHVSAECLDCHATGYAGTTMVCGECHANDYNQSLNPNHSEAGISTDCALCHTTEPDWKPATFPVHDDYFPLTGAHATVECFTCHEEDYSNTPNTCFGCHSGNFNQTTNPNHGALSLSNDCELCHTTNPDWKPATFPVHNNYYVLEGAHAAISNDCFACHEGNYLNTPNTCYQCHQPEYNQTSDPPHQSAQFPTDCETCHTQNAWEPSTFEHDGQYFPIYSGSHEGEWNSCSDCHTNPSNYNIFTCLPCHPQGETNSEHEGIPGYVYESNACYACHPTGGAGGFNHSTTEFPLTGAHTTVDCQSCHANGYTGTTMICGECHATAYNQSVNPNHLALSIPNECETCHTTNPNWQPATFPIHNNYYVLAGAHVAIANDCAVCHNGNYNNTPNTCYQCHQSDYNQTNDPPHQSAQFPTECETCHTQNAWVPSTFDHDNQYFPIYSGDHQGEWNTCSDCHNNPGNYNIFTCLTCHEQGETDDEHEDVPGYVYESNACYACHPTGNGGGKFMNHR